MPAPSSAIFEARARLRALPGQTVTVVTHRPACLTPALVSASWTNSVERRRRSDWQFALLAVDVELGGGPASRSCRTHGQVVEAPAGDQRLVRVAAEHAEQAPHLGRRPPAGLFDRLEHLARGRLRVAEHSAAPRRLRTIVETWSAITSSSSRAIRARSSTTASRRSYVALAFGEPGPALTVAENAADEQHHHGLRRRRRAPRCSRGFLDPRSWRDRPPRPAPNRARSGAAASRPRGRTARRRSRSG